MTRQMKIIDIGFQIGTGRANLDVEQAAMELVGVDCLSSLPRVLKAADDATVDAVWGVVCGRGKSVMG